MTNIVAILVKKAALEFDKIANPYFAEYDLTASQYRIFKFLYAQPSRTARIVDLERQYSMTHPTTIGLLDALEKKGFTTRVENPNDARGLLVICRSGALFVSGSSFLYNEFRKLENEYVNSRKRLESIAQTPS